MQKSKRVTRVDTQPVMPPDGGSTSWQHVAGGLLVAAVGWLGRLQGPQQMGRGWAGCRGLPEPYGSLSLSHRGNLRLGILVQLQDTHFKEGDYPKQTGPRATY